MLIPSIFVFLTLVYREIGKQIIHPVPVRWKANMDNSYLVLCDRITQNRLERNAALGAAFKITSLAGFALVILMTIIVGRNKFLLEIAIGLCFLINLNFSIPERKQFFREIIRSILLFSGISMLGIILFEYNILEQPELRIITG